MKKIVSSKVYLINNFVGKEIIEAIYFNIPDINKVAFHKALISLNSIFLSNSIILRRDIEDTIREKTSISPQTKKHIISQIKSQI